MNKFSKPEIISILVIFLLLIIISFPNFILSLRRARDQVRKDDMGALEQFLGDYLADFQAYPLVSSDGKILACKNAGEKVEINAMGKLIVNWISCEWGRDGIVNLTPGSTKEYIHILPREPNYEKGASYRYFSDGRRFQIFVSLEGKDEDEYDPKIIARNIMCGNIICNAGRVSGCPVDKTLEECEEETLKK